MVPDPIDLWVDVQIGGGQPEIGLEELHDFGRFSGYPSAFRSHDEGWEGYGRFREETAVEDMSAVVPDGVEFRVEVENLGRLPQCIMGEVLRAFLRTELISLSPKRKSTKNACVTHSCQHVFLQRDVALDLGELFQALRLGRLEIQAGTFDAVLAPQRCLRRCSLP